MSDEATMPERLAIENDCGAQQFVHYGKPWPEEYGYAYYIREDKAGSTIGVDPSAHQQIVSDLNARIATLTAERDRLERMWLHVKANSPALASSVESLSDILEGGK